MGGDAGSHVGLGHLVGRASLAGDGILTKCGILARAFGAHYCRQELHQLFGCVGAYYSADLTRGQIPNDAARGTLHGLHQHGFHEDAVVGHGGISHGNLEWRCVDAVAVRKDELSAEAVPGRDSRVGLSSTEDTGPPGESVSLGILNQRSGSRWRRRIPKGIPKLGCAHVGGCGEGFFQGNRVQFVTTRIGDGFLASGRGSP